MEPGSRLGPYEIVAPLGVGGMGEVYRARDARLGRDVAIKVLPPAFAGDPERLRRFEREGRAASALNHPNITVLHDVGTHDGIPYMVEELLEGETVRERLKAGALPARKAMELAVQVAAGLAAAHEKGIVHRDLKPENLFVTSDGHVKILDFGIAKLQPREQHEPGGPAATVVETTEPGVVMGTVAYMSPEQVRGQPADNRSDIFSLGAVLYEMATGRRAFARDTGAETMAAILKEEPPEASSIEGGVPAALSRSIAHCLEKRPEERFQSARDLAFDLRAILSDTGGTRTAGPSAAAARRRRPLWLIAGSVAALAVAVGAILAVRGRTAGTGPVLEPKRIVVALFENQTGDASLAPLGRMASDWIAQGLSQISVVEVVPTSATVSAEQAAARDPAVSARADPLRALAESTGAGTVVSGSYYLVGQELHLQARVTDAVHGKLLSAIEPVAGPRGSPMQVLEALRQRIMGVVAARFESHVVSLNESRPPIYEAYREYVAGIELFGEDYTRAIRHFERAVEIDADFMTPQLYLAVSYGNQGDYERAAAIIERVNAVRERLSPFERHMLNWYLALLAGHDAEAMEAIQRARALVPRSQTLAYISGLAAIRLNRPRLTVETFTAIAADGFFDNRSIPGSWRFTILMVAHHMLSEYERELEVADRAIRAFPDLLSVRGGQVRALAALGRLDEVSRVVDECLAVQSRVGTPGELMQSAAAELRAHSHREAALRMAERAVAWLESRPLAEKEKPAHRSELAHALYAAERWDEARGLYEELSAACPVVDRKGKPPEARLSSPATPERVRVSRAVDYLGFLGALAARRGDRQEALRISDELARVSQPFLFGAHTYWRACIAALLGEKQGAVDLLRESIAQGNSYDITLHRDADLESLHGYPPFDELLRLKG